MTVKQTNGMAKVSRILSVPNIKPTSFACIQGLLLCAKKLFLICKKWPIFPEVLGITVGSAAGKMD